MSSARAAINAVIFILTMYSAAVAVGDEASASHALGACAVPVTYVRAKNTPALTGDEHVQSRPRLWGGSILGIIEPARSALKPNGKPKCIRIEYLNADGSVFDLLILDRDGKAQYVRPANRINNKIIIDKAEAMRLIDRFRSQLTDKSSEISGDAEFNVWSPLKAYVPELFEP